MRLRLCLPVLALLVMGLPASAEFGLVEEAGHYQLDSGAGLVLRIRRDSGGIDSLQWQGTELQQRGKETGLASGLGPKGTHCFAQRSGDLIKVTVETDSAHPVVANLTQYLVLRRHDHTLYLATFAQDEPHVGELRWITRLDASLFPTAPVPSDLRATTGAIESKDIFGQPDGQTRSKYYGNVPTIDLTMSGVSGAICGVYLWHGNRESSSGGPFFRDIQIQTGKAAEVYNYMNSGHNQTEPPRLGVLHGPYAVTFTPGPPPSSPPETDFLADLNLKGFVPREARGQLHVETFSGLSPSQTYTLALANETAQYWCRIPPDHPSADCAGIKPGDYRLTLYRGELAVTQRTVTIAAGQTTRLSALAAEEDPSALACLWRIGDWDGTPLEFRNGARLALMHPSDVRMQSWQGEIYRIGDSAPIDFPACQWRDVNAPLRITFPRPPRQAGPRKLRIGITAAYAGARPQIRVNQWTAKPSPPSSQPKSRSLTLGTYRGHNQIYEFEIPESAWIEGLNRVEIFPISGQQAFNGFLSPGYAFDCMDLR